MRRLVCVLILLGSVANAQTERITVMTYNLMYYRASAPCSHTQNASQRDGHLKTIFDYLKPTIMVVNELGSGVSTSRFLLDNVINTQGVNSYDNALSTNNAFSSIVNQVFFDTTLIGLHSQDYIQRDLSNNDLVRVIDIYRLFYKDPKLDQGADTVFINVVAAHLKAGSSSANRFEREDAIKALMQYISQNLADENVILAGDLNVQVSSEPSFSQLINYSDVDARFYDPVNQLGSWNNNSSYAAVHTQSTHSSGSGCFSGGGLDDRFDFLLVSDEIDQGSLGVSYYPNSYLTIGNDGNHFNQSITAGTNSSAPSSIINALYNFSDHLPVMMSLSVEKSDISLEEIVYLNRIHFANPVDDNVMLSNKPAHEPISTKVFSITGKLMKEVNWSEGSTKMQINCESWPAGIYLLSFTDKSGAGITRKLIVQ